MDFALRTGKQPSPLRDRLRGIKEKLLGREIPPWPVMPYPTIELTYWKPAGGVNFGDELSRTITELMLARRGVTIQDEIPASKQLLAVGSVLHHAREGAIIWGSGVNGSTYAWQHRARNIDVRAVRGPRTRDFLSRQGINVPEVYGDPAILLPELTNGRFSVTGRDAIAFVPNLHDMALVKDNPPNDIRVIDPKRSWNVVVKDILECRLVLASSLHGLVVAEAFGIPARYVRLSDREGLFKYADYYEGTGRPLEFATSLEQARDMGGHAEPKIDRQALMDAFPYDIWI
jgi:pyruvyltransferase